MQYVVPVQHAVGQHADGVEVTLGPQQPPGLQMNAEPSEQLDTSVEAPPPGLTPRCCAPTVLELAELAVMRVWPELVAMVVIVKARVADTLRPDSRPL